MRASRLFSTRPALRGLLLCVVGALITGSGILGIVSALHQGDVRDALTDGAGVTAEGTLTEVVTLHSSTHRTRYSDTEHCPRYAFTAADGSRQTVLDRTQCSDRADDFTTGSTIPVLYDPADPKVAIIDTPGARGSSRSGLLFAIPMTLLGLGLLIAAPSAVRRARRNRAAEDAARAEMPVLGGEPTAYPEVAAAAAVASAAGTGSETDVSVTERFARRVASGLDGTPFMVEPCPDGFRVGFALADARWWSILQYSDVRDSITYTVRVDERKNRFRIDDTLRTLSWSAGATGMVPRLGVSSSIRSGRIRYGRIIQLGLDPGGVLTAFSPDAERARIVETGRSLGLRPGAGRSTLIGLWAAGGAIGLCIIGASTALLIIALTG
ncbi:DUF3592 domain-containing protein [Clavibacter sepedonicus]|nr:MULTISPECIES: DUF3592 domain-containing protein [Clavibacter]MBD5382174.1 DUF3592 domain-containing protein [Clavibacter sp.]OQJ48890.1 hypothetical protein B5P19_12015 [Clavibacter sepedonicus]OQJ53799.1 hypothetical protein B5P20_06435 [Clavibacter sepedonicus]UUK65307.1 DUF3592 domain-containing protein [Clavibacter sepedonicus]